MIERPAYYALPYSDLAGGGSQFGVEIKLDPDAPFRLIGIAIWTLGGVDSVGVGSLAFPTGVQIRYTRPDRMWVQRNMVPGNTLTPGYGVGFNVAGGSNYMLWSPVSVNMVYPPSGIVAFDIQTQPNVNRFEAVIVLVGTKLFRDGGVWAPTYPAKWNALPFFGYGVQCDASKLPLLNQPMPIGADADFAWQASTYSDTGGVSAFLVIASEDPPPGSGVLLFTATGPGAAGNAITVEVDNGLGAPGLAFNLTVIGSAITIQLATDGTGAVTTTTQQVIDAVNADAAASLLVVASSLGGAGLQSPHNNAPQNLAGGLDVVPNQLFDLGVRIKDFDGKYYMNGFIPVGLLYGFGFPQVPGLPYPEIYIPKNQALYFDFQWIASSGFPVPPQLNTATLTHKGMKVYS